MKGKVTLYYPNCEISVFEDVYVEKSEVSYIRFRTNTGNWIETSLPFLHQKAVK